MEHTGDGNRRWWHYTLGTTLISMIADERIKRATAYYTGRGERKAVWFSCRETWEPTATKGCIEGTAGLPRDASVSEMVAHGGALVRIEVPADVARHTWAEHRKIGGIDPRIADGLEEVARERGADPSEWRVSYHDVPLAKIVGIEASDDGVRWHPVGVFDSETRGIALEPAFAERVRQALGVSGSPA